MGFIRIEQGLSEVLPNQAVSMTRGKMDTFMQSIGLDSEGRRGVTRLRMRERRAMYAFCFSDKKRLAGAGHVVASHSPSHIRL